MALLVALGACLVLLALTGCIAVCAYVLRDQKLLVDRHIQRTADNFIALSAWAANSDGRTTTLEQVAELRVADEFDRVIEGRA